MWHTGTKIDVFRRKAVPDDSIVINEIKVGYGTPINLYQLKMYWDGLLVTRYQQKEAIFFVSEYSTAMESMAYMMNALPPPQIEGIESLPYNFKITKLKDIDLWYIMRVSSIC